MRAGGMRPLFGVVLVAVTLLSAGNGKAQTEDSAVAFLKGIYDSYIRTAGGAAGPHIARSIYSPPMQQLWRQVDVLEKKCGPIIDWDPIIDAQDWIFRRVDIKAVNIAPAAATVAISFQNGKDDTGTVITADLVSIGRQWKIDDLHYNKHPEDLRTFLKQGIESAAKC